MGPDSLARRIIVLSGAWVIVALTFSALLLVYSYRDHEARHYDEHVAMHMEELLDAGVLNQDGVFELRFEPSDPRYHVLHSGWYWEVKGSGQSLKRSPSLGETSLHIGPIQPTQSVVVHELNGPIGERLRVQILEVRLDPASDPYVYLASAPIGGYTEDVVNYTGHIIGSFILLGFGLLLAVVLQVRTALKPLKAISIGIGEVRDGRAAKLPPSRLDEVRPLVDELNNLLDHNAVLLKRARNQLADLAHSVKNPLSVINNEARNMGSDQKDLILRQTRDISRNVDHYLTRARTFGTEKVLGARSEVKAAAEDLVFAMQRIYQDRNLDYDFSGLSESWLKGEGQDQGPEEIWFRGEGQDLEEMLGNLLDNASKWASNRVSIRARMNDKRLFIVVEDDGPGIPEDEIENVMRRGHKLDESKPGHGQGLGIVRDIVDLYGGKLVLSRSALGGLKATLDLPAA